MPLAVDPASPERVYLGTPSGLFRTVDGGKNWTQAAELGNVGILAVTAASDSTRTNVYISTPGGMLSGGTAALADGRRVMSSPFLAAGVHKETISNQGTGEMSYLPFILKHP